MERCQNMQKSQFFLPCLLLKVPKIGMWESKPVPEKKGGLVCWLDVYFYFYHMCMGATRDGATRIHNGNQGRKARVLLTMYYFHTYQLRWLQTTFPLSWIQYSPVSCGHFQLQPSGSNNLLITPWCQITQQTFRGCVKSMYRDVVEQKLARHSIPLLGMSCYGGTRCFDSFTLPGDHQPRGSHILKSEFPPKTTLRITIANPNPNPNPKKSCPF